MRAVPTGRYPARPLAQDSDSPQDWGVEMQRSRRKSPGIAGKEGSVPFLDVELREARVSGLSSREGLGASEHAAAEGAPHPPTAPPSMMLFLDALLFRRGVANLSFSS